MFLLIVLAALHCASAATTCDCDYASTVTDEKEFAFCVAMREGRALIGTALDPSGMTRDGSWISYDSGKSTMIHNFSAPSKESLHLAIIALALSHNLEAQLFIVAGQCRTNDLGNCITLAKERGAEVAFTMLKKKMDVLEQWNEQNPGYGGYLPWFRMTGAGKLVPVLPDWNLRIPGLDNGEMIWGLIAAREALLQLGNDTSYLSLGARIEAYLEVMSRSAFSAWRSNSSCIRAITIVKSAIANPDGQNFADSHEGGCLDDPYEGEMLIVWMTLLNRTAMADVWKAKHAKALFFKGAMVQQGFWFSAHEQWKYVFLPYSLLPFQHAILLNGEKARTSYANECGFSGMFASVTNVTRNGTSGFPPYLSGAGIAELASQPVNSTYVVTPYSTWVLMLVNRSCGLTWYRNMIIAPGMSGPLGSSAAISRDGKSIAPVITWDSKATTVLGIMGGVADIVASFLARKMLLKPFLQQITEFYGPILGNASVTKDLSFMSPNRSIPKMLRSFCSN
jgi:hypothetical protein